MPTTGFNNGATNTFTYSQTVNTGNLYYAWSRYELTGTDGRVFYACMDKDGPESSNACVPENLCDSGFESITGTYTATLDPRDLGQVSSVCTLDDDNDGT